MKHNKPKPKCGWGIAWKCGGMRLPEILCRDGFYPTRTEAIKVAVEQLGMGVDDLTAAGYSLVKVRVEPI